MPKTLWQKLHRNASLWWKKLIYIFIYICIYIVCIYFFMCSFFQQGFLDMLEKFASLKKVNMSKQNNCSTMKKFFKNYLHRTWLLWRWKVWMSVRKSGPCGKGQYTGMYEYSHCQSLSVMWLFLFTRWVPN